MATSFAVPLAAIAQQAAIVRKIGVLALGPQPTKAELAEEAAPLRALGWVEGKNLLVERRYANGRTELLRPFAEELVRLKVELIATLSTPAGLAAKNATSTIPIVIWSAGDAVSSGIAPSLSRPGGNVTGLSQVGLELDAKLLSLLRELLPALQRVGLLTTTTNPYQRTARIQFEQLCRSVGIELVVADVPQDGEPENAVAEISRQRATALVVAEDAQFFRDRVRIMNAARQASLPVVTEDKDFLAEGALVTYSYSDTEQNERFASFVDRILRGAKPGELPMEQPTNSTLGST